jgi:hypothetical protein
MMKNVIKFLGLLSLIGFSFFYTDSVMDVVVEQDSIMVDINNVKDNYSIEAIDAVIDEDSLIPGINGKIVNTTDSYNNMKSIGVFNKNYLVYDEVSPNISMYDNYNKYITKGNSFKHMVSLVFILKNDTYLQELYKIVSNKGIKINFFIDYNFLNSNSNLLKELDNTAFYSYGIEGEYSPDTLLFSNNLIQRITKNNPNYCLTENKNKSILELCSNNKMFTIIPTINIKNNIYNEIKSNVTSGSIILVDINSENLKGLDISIDYIKGKGLEFEYLEELLTEKN